MACCVPRSLLPAMRFCSLTNRSKHQTMEGTMAVSRFGSITITACVKLDRTILEALYNHYRLVVAVETDMAGLDARSIGLWQYYLKALPSSNNRRLGKQHKQSTSQPLIRPCLRGLSLCFHALRPSCFSACQKILVENFGGGIGLTGRAAHGGVTAAGLCGLGNRAGAFLVSRRWVRFLREEDSKTFPSA